ncbi:uncharacterized protein FPRO_05014 [Fusarium proliferatum ET1]|uniref:Uncharacterized protein n=1 Tax=Fusarium proliferatum (strain ET1) TaxID=1227346 RepID=A0A1L7VKK5_FUSPR|nr:uncharacterized protein FPRO_05014 [Fusarium proliferatum ET1]CVL07974.1 uncharacterized protein FPRN_04865 [Fusarium proliferatum]CZR40115.1 uncharacterized protein FPRO_05014 [Fusarium proliferatum ET1]
MACFMALGTFLLSIRAEDVDSMVHAHYPRKRMPYNLGSTAQ